jgi:predicted transcriptional regulator
MTTILSFSLPAGVQVALDAEAKRQRRSRSFVAAEAIREYVARHERAAFAGARDRTLREGLALTPAARVRLAEHLWAELAKWGKAAPPGAIGFDTFDQYDAWRRQGGDDGG